MSCLSEHHKTLTNGIGKCSVPMWMNGCPAGFCDKDAYGERPACKEYIVGGQSFRHDGKYSGYVPALACPIHGGPTKEDALNLCKYCQKEIPECNGNPQFGNGIGKDNVFDCDGFVSKNANDKYHRRHRKE